MVFDTTVAHKTNFVFTHLSFYWYLYASLITFDPIRQSRFENIYTLSVKNDSQRAKTHFILFQQWPTVYITSYYWSRNVYLVAVVGRRVRTVLSSA